MKHLYIIMILLISSLSATPSSIFWTNCTTDIQDAGVADISVTNFFGVFNKDSKGSYLSPDIGFEQGLPDWEILKSEIGVDYFGGSNNPLYFNFGFAIYEGKLFANAPAFKLGFFNAGAQYNRGPRTNQNVVDFIVGKTLPRWLGGRIFVGGFWGTKALGEDRQGVMVAYQYQFCPAKSCEGKDYFKWEILADYSSGKNQIGGGGVGIGYNFSPEINITTGPVFFNTAKYNGSWKWNFQVNIYVPTFSVK